MSSSASQMTSADRPKPGPTGAGSVARARTAKRSGSAAVSRSDSRVIWPLRCAAAKDLSSPTPPSTWPAGWLDQKPNECRSQRNGDPSRWSTRRACWSRSGASPRAPGGQHGGGWPQHDAAWGRPRRRDDESGVDAVAQRVVARALLASPDVDVDRSSYAWISVSARELWLHCCGVDHDPVERGNETSSGGIRDDQGADEVESVVV